MNIWLTIGVAYAILTLSAMVWIIVGHVKNKKLKDAMEKHRQGLRIEDSLPNDIYILRLQRNLRFADIIRIFLH